MIARFPMQQSSVLRMKRGKLRFKDEKGQEPGPGTKFPLWTQSGNSSTQNDIARTFVLVGET